MKAKFRINLRTIALADIPSTKNSALHYLFNPPFHPAHHRRIMVPSFPALVPSVHDQPYRSGAAGRVDFIDPSGYGDGIADADLHIEDLFGEIDDVGEQGSAAGNYHSAVDP
jgi:hypothetical protein